MFLTRFMTRRVQKSIKISRTSQLVNFTFFIYKTNFLKTVFDRIYRHLNFPSGIAFCKNLKYFFMFSTSPIFFCLEMANDRYKDTPEVFFIYSLGLPLGVLGPILSKIRNNIITF